MVGDSENYSLGRLKSVPGQEFNSVFALRSPGICNRIMRLDRNSKPLKLTDDIHDLAIAYVGNVLLESEAENRHPAVFATGPAIAIHDHSNTLASNSSAHGIIHSSAGENNFWMIP
jgi:hypothetical protein